MARASSSRFSGAGDDRALTRDIGQASKAEDRPLEEAELIGLAQRGDVAAYAELVRRNQEVAFRTAYLIAGDAADAEDVSQDAFVKAHRALHRFKSGSALRPWLLRIVANEARNRRRANRRREGADLRLARDRLFVGGGVPSPEEAVLADERRAGLLAAVNGLREEDRLVIACRYFLELADAETAAALNWPVGTVKSRLSRALGRLRAAMVEEGR